MSLEYYLLNRTAYKHTLLYIDNILQLLSDVTNPLEVDLNLFSQQMNSKKVFEEERLRCIMMIQACNDKINELCQHEYIEDEIDIDPEISQRITYCHICEHSK